MAWQAPVRLLVGTSKGAFTFLSDPGRRHWQRRGPWFPGWQVPDLIRLPGSGRLLAATSHLAYGATVRISDDDGASWRQVVASPRFPPGSGRTVTAIWRFAPAPALGSGAATRGATVFAGTGQTGLFASHDGGESWAEVAHLSAQLRPAGPSPEPEGDGGGCLHSVAFAGGRMWAATSRDGVFRSDDLGHTWVRCRPVPPHRHDADSTSRTHKLAADSRRPGVLFLQGHSGLFRSPDGGDSWQPVHDRLPGPFGFPAAVDRAGAVWAAPLSGADERFMPGGRLAVYRSSDAGLSWQERRAGMPTEPHFVGVLRDALTTDDVDPVGVYVGTTSGEIYASADSGESWQQLPGRLTRITSIRAMPTATDDG